MTCAEKSRDHRPVWKHRPLPGMALAVIVGLVLGRACHAENGSGWNLPVILAGIAASAMPLFLHRMGGLPQGLFSRLSACTLSGLLFVSAYSLGGPVVHARLLGVPESAVGPPVTVRVRFAENDTVQVSDKKAGRGVPRFRAKVLQCRSETRRWTGRACGWIDVFWPPDMSLVAPSPGQVWQFENVRIIRYAWPRRAGPFLLLHPNPGSSTCLALPAESGWRAVCRRTRRAASLQLERGIANHALESGLLKALLLGERGQLDPGVRELAIKTGTVHIFAISGLHVGIIAAIFICMLTACGVSRTRWAWWLIPLLASYAVMTGARASAVRACIMAGVYFLAPALKRQTDAVSALAAACLLILLFDPVQVFDLGFQFSFIVVTGLLLYCPLLWDLVKPFCAPDPLMPPVENRCLRALRTLQRYFFSLAVMSVAAWIFSMPLSAGYFGRIAPGALLGNCVVIPLTFTVVLSGFLSIVTGPLVPPVGECFNHAAVSLLQMLTGSLQAFAAVSGDIRLSEYPPVWGVWGAYALLVIAGLWLHVRRASRRTCAENPDDDSDESVGLRRG